MMPHAGVRRRRRSRQRVMTICRVAIGAVALPILMLALVLTVFGALFLLIEVMAFDPPVAVLMLMGLFLMVVGGLLGLMGE